MCWSSRELRQQLQYGSFTQFTFAPSPSQSSLRQVNTHDYWHYYNYKLLLSEFSLLVSIILVKFPFRLNLKCNCNSFTEWYIRWLHNLISRLNCLIVTTALDVAVVAGDDHVMVALVTGEPTPDIYISEKDGDLWKGDIRRKKWHYIDSPKIIRAPKLSNPRKTPMISIYV